MRRQKARWLSPAALVAVASLLFLGACTPPKPVLKSPAQVLAEIEPGLRIFKPATPGPYPTVLLLHGAGDKSWWPGWQPVADDLVAHGYAVVFVDSYANRAFSGPALRSGTFLPGERAGDLLVTLDWLKTQNWAAPGRTAAIGWSHGATTIMDGLVLAPPAAKPTGLTAAPADALHELSAAALFYPWCSGPIAGFELVKAVDHAWTEPVPVLAFLPMADTVSDAGLCKTILDRQKAQGLPVEIVTFEGASHGFDQPTDDHGATNPGYDGKVTQTAMAALYAFLDRQLRK